MTWLKGRQWQRQENTKTMTKTNTFREHLQRASPVTCDLSDIWSEWWGDMNWPTKKMTKTNTKTKKMTKTVTKTIPETCDIWNNNYNSDNWEPEFMTISVAWQLKVTLDSIRNSWDVLSLIRLLLRIHRILGAHLQRGESTASGLHHAEVLRLEDGG